MELVIQTDDGSQQALILEEDSYIHPVRFLPNPEHDSYILPIDAAIAPVVEALWSIGVMTYSSCQHDGKEPAAIEMTTTNAEKLGQALASLADRFAWMEAVSVQPLRGTVRNRKTGKCTEFIVSGYRVLRFPLSHADRLARGIMS